MKQNKNQLHLFNKTIDEGISMATTNLDFRLSDLNIVLLNSVFKYDSLSRFQKFCLFNEIFENGLNVLSEKPTKHLRIL